MRKVLITLGSLCFFVWNTTADPLEFEPIPIKPPNFDRPICKIVDDGFAGDTQFQIKQIQQAIQCGRYKQALRKISQLYNTVEDEMVFTSGQGVCYDVRGCVEPNRLFNSLKSKSACAAAGGLSWKRTRPSAGRCQRVN